ncbi:MAG: biopolymer transporter ExbD [Verrucomicrobiota bacterium JB022]|nr:biopolymer transporter ExbD [Verrucomicrobiota bacterium JB022]
MKRKHRLESDLGDDTRIDLSPMIDCIFILLIFFIVTTVFVDETGFEMMKPDAAAAQPQEDARPIQIEITAADQIRLDQAPLSISQLANRLGNLRIDEETTVSIRAHGDSRHQTLVEVWDAARAAGISKISFTTFN